jgi:hypothetical protein
MPLFYTLRDYTFSFYSPHVRSNLRACVRSMGRKSYMKIPPRKISAALGVSKALYIVSCSLVLNPSNLAVINRRPQQKVSKQIPLCADDFQASAIP